MLDHQVAVEQQLDGVVQGGSADAVFVVFHSVIERFDVEMPVVGVDLLKDGKPLRGLAEIMRVKVFGEYLLDGQRYVFVWIFHVLDFNSDERLFSLLSFC